jgi:hypothetical protein
MQRGIIEVAPLAFMRGRTLNDSFIILDEAQNATREQMKMFLTRIGYGSSAVVTGDASQIDLIEKQTSGLTHAARILEGLEGVSVVRFEEVDVVRHPLVRRVVAAYDRQEALEREQEEERFSSSWRVGLPWAVFSSCPRQPPSISKGMIVPLRLRCRRRTAPPAPTTRPPRRRRGCRGRSW